MTTSELTEPLSSHEQTSLLHKGATSIGECRWEGDRKVFVKRLRRELTDDERHREAFRKEFEIGRTFDCPSLVRFIRMEGDTIVEEFIDGTPLDAFVKENRDFFGSEGNLRTMLLQLLEGLGYLHERQILHLDLKPANVMITRLGNHVKIVDFGFSYTDSFILSTGGTRGFAAPEQFERGAELNVTADIFALGHILMFIDKEVGLPKRYRAIAERCCREKPEERFQSVDEVRDALTHKRHKVSLLICLLLMAGVAGLLLCYSNHYEIPEEVFRVKKINYKATSDSTLMVAKTDTIIQELDLVIPEKVRYVGHSYRVTAIGEAAYRRCENLIALTLPKSIDTIYCLAFADCGNITNVYIPDNVRFIEREAFRRCYKLKAVRLPEGISSLEKGLFSICRGLEEIDVPANVKELKQDAFGICTNLRTVHLHEGLEVIGRGVFWKCESLRSLVIPSTVRELGDYVFWGCTNLTDLYMKGSNPPRITNIFGDNHLRIHVPRGSEQNYRDAIFWKDQEIIPE